VRQSLKRWRDMSPEERHQLRENLRKQFNDRQKHPEPAK